ncbi:MAG TPA: hypothetical protein VHD87_11780 [Acidimicrobiales bacterium]|nr:hypothetical protein [Acidimicrobiales bacterium]
MAVLNGVVGLVVLLLVAVLALVVKPPAPPGLAAFAPQANKTITKAPQQQSSNFGSGAGQCAAGQACNLLATTTTSVPGVERRGVPSALQCFKWPDGTVTQTFDPQSPPCVAGWDNSKGNGGPTAAGVTQSEIRVALPMNSTSPTYPKLQPIVDFFNTHYQFYGRKITIVPYTSQQASDDYTGAFDKPEDQRADATQTTQLRVFASFDFVDPIHYSWSLPVYLDILARAKIVSINGGEMTPYGTSADLAARYPYVWTYYTPIDSLMTTYAQMVCRQLAGKPASHAGNAVLRQTTRKFAVLMPEDADVGGAMPGLSTLLRGLGSCGINSPTVQRYHVGTGSETTNSAWMSQLRRDGVTSMIWFPFVGSSQPSHPQQVASAIGYQPEWVTIGWNNYLTASNLNAPANETGAEFGVGVWNKMPAIDLDFWHRAFLAAGGDQAVVNSGALTDGLAFYNEMLLLSAGIQMAGPNLTPDSFARGLRSTRFPNPGAGGPPFYQGTVGVGPDDVTMVKDFNGFWLDTRYTGAQVTSSSNLETDRAYCYPQLGRRFTGLTWPATDGYYANGVCR